jgi:hypothetical protein
VTEFFIVCELFQFILKSGDERTRPRDVEDLGDAVSALDEASVI